MCRSLGSLRLGLFFPLPLSWVLAGCLQVANFFQPEEPVTLLLRLFLTCHFLASSSLY